MSLFTPLTKRFYSFVALSINLIKGIININKKKIKRVEKLKEIIVEYLIFLLCVMELYRVRSLKWLYDKFCKSETDLLLEEGRLIAKSSERKLETLYLKKTAISKLKMPQNKECILLVRRISEAENKIKNSITLAVPIQKGNEEIGNENNSLKNN